MAVLTTVDCIGSYILTGPLPKVTCFRLHAACSWHILFDCMYVHIYTFSNSIHLALMLIVCAWYVHHISTSLWVLKPKQITAVCSCHGNYMSGNTAWEDEWMRGTTLQISNAWIHKFSQLECAHYFCISVHMAIATWLVHIYTCSAHTLILDYGISWLVL